MYTDNQHDPASRFRDALSGRYTQLITQPSTRCNVNCDYCYLKGRERRQLMSVDVAAAIAEGITDQDAPVPVTVSWHGGEPLTTGRSHFERLLEPFEPLRRRGRVRHDIRTNATLISDSWCELFAAYDFRVGVSIDGPRPLNVNRVDWHGNEIYERVIAGIERVKAHGLQISAHCVVSPETIDRARELLMFLDELAPESVGINLEERENNNAHRPLLSREQATAFWREVITHLRAGSGLTVREVGYISAYLARTQDGRDPHAPAEPVPTIAFNGDVVVVSPELAGATAPEHDNFVVGNILTTPLTEIVAGLQHVPYVRQFAEGLAACQASCSFWEYCGGANNAANRYFEHGELTVTETAHCRNSRQAPVLALLSILEGEPRSAHAELTDTLERLAVSVS